MHLGLLDLFWGEGKVPNPASSHEPWPGVREKQNSDPNLHSHAPQEPGAADEEGLRRGVGEGRARAPASDTPGEEFVLYHLLCDLGQVA